MVLYAGADGAMQALNELCQLYWRPLQAYCCGLGRSPADAEDLTQAFFAKLLGRGALRMADPQRGKFRTFLLTSFKNHLMDEHRRSQAQKRGSGSMTVSLDADEAEQLHPVVESSPERAFDRQWAEDVVSRATQALRQEYTAAGKGQWFEKVAGSQAASSYIEAAKELASTEEAVKSFALRVRKRFRAQLEREIADTVSTPEEVADEMTYLASLLRG